MRFPFGPDYHLGEERLMVEKTEKLYMELSALENRGVTIWLEGTPSDSLNVSNELSIHEDTPYMRDYVFEEGRLKEVHFDKVLTDNNDQ